MIDSTAWLQNLRDQHGDSPSVSISPLSTFPTSSLGFAESCGPIAGQLELWFETAEAFLT